MPARSPLIFGILNLTPDSFSDAGRFQTSRDALRHAEKMIESGADVIDVGGESTRPNATPVTPHEELARVLPIVKKLHASGITISLDSRRASVIEKCLPYIDYINDVEGLRDPAMRRLAAISKKRVIVMHATDVPVVPENIPRYKNVVRDIITFFEKRIDECVRDGVKKNHIIVDPGIGFGKSLAHNLSLIHHLDDFASLGCDVLLGASRKSFIGKLDHSNADDRLGGSLAAVLAGFEKGVAMFRVHDVQQTRQVLVVAEAIRKAK